MEIIAITTIIAVFFIITKWLESHSKVKDFEQFKERTITQLQNLEVQTNDIRNRLNELEH